MTFEDETLIGADLLVLHFRHSKLISHLSDREYAALRQRLEVAIRVTVKPYLLVD